MKMAMMMRIGRDNRHSKWNRKKAIGTLELLMLVMNVSGVHVMHAILEFKNMVEDYCERRALDDSVWQLSWMDA